MEGAAAAAALLLLAPSSAEAVRIGQFSAARLDLTEWTAGHKSATRPDVR